MRLRTPRKRAVQTVGCIHGYHAPVGKLLTCEKNCPVDIFVVLANHENIPDLQYLIQ